MSRLSSRPQIKGGADQYASGQQLMAAEMFKEGDLVDIAGKSIGKGFQGARPHHPRVSFFIKLVCVKRLRTTRALQLKTTSRMGGLSCALTLGEIMINNIFGQGLAFGGLCMLALAMWRKALTPPSVRGA